MLKLYVTSGIVKLLIAIGAFFFLFFVFWLFFLLGGGAGGCI